MNFGYDFTKFIIILQGIALVISIILILVIVDEDESRTPAEQATAESVFKASVIAMLVLLVTLSLSVARLSAVA